MSTQTSNHTERYKEIHLEKPNTLSEFLSPEERQNLVSLKITGVVGTKDFEGVLDDMCHTWGKYDEYDDFIPDYEESAALRHLDMGEATFADGNGLPYFGYRSHLETFILPKGIETLVETGFSESEELQTLVFPDGMKQVRDFDNCPNLTNLVLPESLEEIDSFAFSGCDAITAIRIPAGVKMMDGSSFAGCNLAAFEVDEQNPFFTAIDGVVYSKDLTTLVAFPSAYPHQHFDVPATIKHIGFGAFMDSRIESIHLPQGLLSIGRMAFQNSRIRGIDLPDTVTEVGGLAFRWCDNLEHIRLSQSLTEIPSQMIGSCRNLKELNVPSSVRKIYYSAIAWSRGIERLTMNDGLEEIVDEGPMLGCGGPLREVIFPKTLQKVPGGVFNYTPFIKAFQLDAANPYFSIVDGALCSKDGKVLFSVPDIERKAFKVSEGIEVIEERALAFLPYISNIELPSTLRVIKARAFQGCNSLKCIRIPASVIKVDRDTLWADNLKTVIMEGTVPPEMTEGVKEDEWIYRDVQLHVQEDAVSAYQSAPGWKCFKVKRCK